MKRQFEIPIGKLIRIQQSLQKNVIGKRKKIDEDEIMAVTIKILEIWSALEGDDRDVFFLKLSKVIKEMFDGVTEVKINFPSKMVKEYLNKNQ